MRDNLIICWSLAEGEVEARIEKVVTGLGEAMEVMPSVWHVASSYAAGEAAEHIRSVMHPESALLVVNASSGALGWFNLEQGERLQQLWDQAAGDRSRGEDGTGQTGNPIISD